MANSITEANKRAIKKQALEFQAGHPESSKKEIVEAFEAAWAESGVITDDMLVDASVYLESVLK